MTSPLEILPGPPLAWPFALLTILTASAALWMAMRARRQSRMTVVSPHQLLDTDYGAIRLEIIADDAEHRFRVTPMSGRGLAAHSLLLIVLRPDGLGQRFDFIDRGAWLETTTGVRPPHIFTVRLTVSKEQNSQDFEIRYREDDVALTTPKRENSSQTREH